MSSDHPTIDDYRTLVDRAREALAGQESRSDEAITAGVQAANRAADAMSDQLDRRVGMAMVGPFSSGKSRLIGTLLGKPDLLPVAELPTTGNVTVLRLVPGREDATATALGRAEVEFLAEKEVAALARDLLDAVAAQASGPEQGRVDVEPLYRAEPLKDDFASVDAWLRANWPGSTGDAKEPPLATAIRQVVDLRDAVHAGREYFGRHMTVETPPEELLTLRSTVDLQPAFPQFREGRISEDRVRDRATAQRKLFPLFKRVTFDVEVPSKVWPLEGFRGERQIVLLDFPGLGGSFAPTRDKFLSGRELADVHTIAVCAPMEDMGSDVLETIYGLLKHHGRSSADLDRSLFLVVTKFDTVAVPQGADGASLLSGHGNFTQLVKNQATYAGGEYSRVALTSSPQGIIAGGFAEPGTTAEDRTNWTKQREDAARTLPGWAPVADQLRPDSPDWADLLEEVVEDGGMDRLRRNLTTHAVQRGAEIKLSWAAKDFSALAAALIAIERAERRLGWEGNAQTHKDVTTFLGGIRRIATAMTTRARELGDVDAVVDDLRSEAVRRVYQWTTWHEILDRAVRFVVKRSEPSDEPEPDVDRTDVLEEQFANLVSDLVDIAAERLYGRSTEWLEVTRTPDVATARAQWTGTASTIRDDVVGVLHRMQPKRVATLEAAIERALDVAELREDIKQQMIELSRVVPKTDQFPLRASHLQPWAARAERVDRDEVARHQYVVLRMRAVVASAAADIVAAEVARAGVALRSAVEQWADAIRTVPTTVPPIGRPRFDPDQKETPKRPATVAGPVATLLQEWRKEGWL